MSTEGYTRGRFVTKKITGPAVATDCSGWADTSDGEWSRGKFVTKKITGPAVVVDCSGWAVVEVPAEFDAGELRLGGPAGAVESGEVRSERDRKVAEALANLRAAVDAAHAAGIRFVPRQAE